MDPFGTASRAIRAGEMNLVLAGGVQSMSHEPYVMGKADSTYSRGQPVEGNTIGWRFVNPLMKKQYDIDSMPETAEKVAEQYQVSRERSGFICLPLTGKDRPSSDKRHLYRGKHAHLHSAPKAGLANI
ncbi:beta-ketoadipyl CoA thiolase PcaF [Marinobacter algicola]|uniref:Beta-ketoadipyl CoA thiolase PcaF n=1 Tax=Marinobacter algicola DG893 TaxID=443152 RepID=A6EZZ3_9GAMM|nr:beta-ketoadipyl CoA thiolase PcaF [Marinobacter algicola]EDM47906.1 beta-ketoadipyl CoA thiolase PcaF [Marinobacter algicola DG893]